VEVRTETGGTAAPFEWGTVFLADHAGMPRRYIDGTPSQVENGWVKTDDVGYLDDNGLLFVVGRKSDVIVTGGHTVSPIEVESTLVQHPQVVEAAVLGLPHPTLGSYVAACVIGSEDLDLESVARFARERLPPHKIPRVIERRAILPRLQSGKVAKRVVRDELIMRHPPTNSDPAGREQSLVRTIWEQELGRPVPATDAPFAAVGGDSLSALRVVSRILDEVTDQVAVDDLLAASTVAAQASLVAAALHRG
jgi:hypothetical protein